MRSLFSTLGHVTVDEPKVPTHRTLDRARYALAGLAMYAEIDQREPIRGRKKHDYEWRVVEADPSDTFALEERLPEWKVTESGVCATFMEAEQIVHAKLEEAVGALRNEYRSRRQRRRKSAFEMEECLTLWCTETPEGQNEYCAECIAKRAATP